MKKKKEINRIGIKDAATIGIFGFAFYGILAFLFSILKFGESGYYLAILGILIYPFYRRYHRIGWDKIKSDIKVIENKITETIKGLFYLLLFMVIGGLVIWGSWKIVGKVVDFITPDKWTLMICETKMGNGVDCQSNSYEIAGFSSAKECLLEGASRFSREGFECGRNCRKEYSINICSEVCNKTGCSK